ncbi:MAG: imidazoleglycerol-phosphate dehydratase [Candidatus Kerfeldbacteria bacterium]|nr:imidazoleglycerol-phosphate dehydratase [Candidatus Kerfeldbacteria bacterium]
MKPRTATIERVTGETNITVQLNLDGTGQVNVKTGYNFLDHMVTLFGWFGFFDLTIAVSTKPEQQPDDHHTVEDVAIALGQAVRQAVGDMEWGNVQGIARYGAFTAVMDEALVLVAVDVYTRGLAVVDLPSVRPTIGDISTEMITHWFDAFARESKTALHVKYLAGENQHHIFESAFKSFGKAMEQATRLEPRLAQQAPGK